MMTKVSYLRLIILLCGITLAIGETIKTDSSNTTANNKSAEKEGGCSAAAGSDQCSRSDAKKLSRKKRSVTLPNSAALVLQSRLFIPQLPVGFYLIWIRVRFYIRAMFTESTIAAAGNPLLQAIARRKRSAGGDDDVVVDNEEEVNNILTRTVADDQLAILKNIEDSLDRGGLSGRQCVLRAICELKETPIHEWSLIGEMIANFMLPKKDNLTALDEYRKAETIGEEHGDCWSFYSACPFSIFNIIPDIYTKDDQIKVTFDDFSAGSGTTKEGPDSEFANDDNGHPDGNAEDDIFEDNADDSLKILLKQFGGTVDDVKEVKIDLDLAKP